MYKAFEAADGGQWQAQVKANQAAKEKAEREAAAGAAAAAAAAARRAAVEDPLNGPPRDTPRAMAPSASEPALKPTAQPIEVFEQKKRRGYKAQGGEDNTLVAWMDGASISSQTTAQTGTSKATTHFSHWSETSYGGSSICSEPGTTNQLHFRHHKRGAAANKNRYAVNNATGVNLKDGVPNIGFPDTERMVTQFNDAYGAAKSSGENITPGMYQSVIQGNAHPFVAQFLDTATPEHQDQFAGMLRSLEYLRKAHARQTTSLARQELDLGENQRLWKPPRQKAMFDVSECNVSRGVPLGTLKQGKEGASEVVAPPPPPTLKPEPPHCPAEMWLGTKPLSPMSTPA